MFFYGCAPTSCTKRFFVFFFFFFCFFFFLPLRRSIGKRLTAAVRTVAGRLEQFAIPGIHPPQHPLTDTVRT